MARIGRYLLGISLFLCALSAQAQVSQKPLPGQDLANTWTNTNTFIALLQCKNFENVQCVDFSNSQGWAGTDIGGWLNSAYAALPANGGQIWLFGNSASTQVNFTTPVVFATSGKYVKVRCMTTNGPTFSGCTLNYTPTTATIAFTLDYTPVAGGGFAPENGLTGFTIQNNGCTTNGGCASSAIGIQTGGTNGGAHMMDLTNMRISGFGKAINDAADSGQSWSEKLINTSLVWNTIGWNMPNAREQDACFGCVINNNGTGVVLGVNGAELMVMGDSIDSNTVGVTLVSGAQLHAIGVHWEDHGVSSLPYVNGASGSKVDIVGGSAYDDVTTSTQASAWFIAGDLTVSSIIVQSFGRITSVSPFSALNEGKIDFINISPTVVPGGGLSFVSKAVTLVNGLNSNIPIDTANIIRITGPSGAFSIGGFGSSTVPAGTDGRTLRVFNASGQPMTIVNGDASSAAANRILTLNNANIILNAISGDSFIDFEYDGASGLWIPTSYNGGGNYTVASTLISGTTPTIAAAGCGGGAASISNTNGTAAFEVNVGTTPGSACTITMPAAAHKWICTATDLTTNSTSVFVQKQSPIGSQTTTQVVITNFSDVAAATAFVASDIMGVSCHAY